MSKSTPTKTELRIFVAAICAMLTVLTYVAVEWSERGVGIYLTILTLLIVGEEWPSSFSLLEELMRPIGLAIFWLLTRGILVLTYYLTVLPISLVMRMFGKDPLDRRWDVKAATYWKKKPPPSHPGGDDFERYRHQF